MSKVLNRAVVAGGVVYSTGTAATPELETLIPNPTHWSGETTPVEYDGVPEAVPVVDVVEAAPAVDAVAELGPEVATPVEYDGVLKVDLVAEVERRNADRAEVDRIVVGGTGKVSDLIAALKADDGA